MQLQHQVLDKLPQVLVQIPREVPEGSGDDTCCRYLVRFGRVPVQIPCEVLEVSGAGTWLGSKGFWCRYLVRFRKFPVQLHDDVPEGLGEDAR